MAKKKDSSEEFEEFQTKYNEAEIPQNKKPINSSKFTLMQQLERFAKFSHNKEESEVMIKEARGL
jgi:hypothetical protein